MIYVNARFLTQRITGVQRFALEICKKLKETRKDIVFLAPDAIINNAEAEALNVETFGSTTGHLWEQLSLPLFLKKKNNPLLLNLANTAPLIYKNQIVTVHDLAFKVNPSWFSIAFSTYYNFLIPLILKKSRRILTVSESSKLELMQSFNIKESKVDVIYNAVSENIKTASNSLAFTNKYKKPYILAVASQDPRKNLNRLIEAFGSIESKAITLLLVGGSSSNFADNKLLNHYFDCIKILGYVSDEELAALYSNAEVFLYPSLYEGFGLPNIEAMYYGCPVITSDIAVCREVCGSAAIYVEPTSIENIAASIDLLLKDSKLREALSRKSITQSRKYSWARSASKVSTILDRLCQNLS